MKNILFAILIAMPCTAFAGIPDSVYVKPHGTPKGEGMYIEWSADGKQWSKSIREAVVSSDYGPWGGGKKLYNPSLTVGPDGLIALVFEVGLEKKEEKAESREKAHKKNTPPSKKPQPKHVKYNQFAVACSYDMVHWRPQDFPYMEGVGQCLSPQITYKDGTYEVTFHNKENVYYSTTTTDLITFTTPVQVQKCEKDSVIRLPYSLVERLSDAEYAYMARAKKNSELARDDAQRFDTLHSLTAEVMVDASSPKAISDKLMGIFFEDINYSADGGLWAELVQNGDFEYTASENHEAKKQHIQWNRITAWSVKGTLTLDTLVQGVSANNPHAVALKVEANQLGASICNEGWDGIPLNKGAKYDLSLYLKGGDVKVSLMKGHRSLASVTLSGGADAWKKVEATLVPSADCDSAVLDIRPLTAGEVAIDMVSLMPQDTYKGHGLRRDLAETLEALHPKFMRFPGGCLVHGDGIENMYHWKETIGPIEDRKPQRNLWNYHQSRRIGYYEFFQMCEDMGMEPLPVLAAGVPCANSSVGGNGQQGGIPMEEMGAYVQDVLDLIEWANGDASTEWGRKRIEQGHEAPFNLRMIGIGNEDLISPTFTERYLMLCKAVKERYPDMIICGTAGPYYCGPDYEEGWKVATEHHDLIDMVDEHYYLPPGWYIHNQDFYDQYDRTGPKVYLGEWAAHGPGRKSTIETALAEAMYYCSLERNADIVVMSSYAPLLAREHHTQWTPDMIYYNNREVKPTVGYFSQKMCGNSAGDQYLESTITTKRKYPGVKERLAVSTVRDSKTGKTYMKIVNLLPVKVDTHVQLKGLLTGEMTCKTTTLTGKYDSTKARPVEGTVTLSPDCHIDLPAYSFTLIEL